MLVLVLMLLAGAPAPAAPSSPAPSSPASYACWCGVGTALRLLRSAVWDSVVRRQRQERRQVRRQAPEHPSPWRHAQQRAPRRGQVRGWVGRRRQLAWRRFRWRQVRRKWQVGRVPRQVRRQAPEHPCREVRRRSCRRRRQLVRRRVRWRRLRRRQMSAGRSTPCRPCRQ